MTLRAVGGSGGVCVEKCTELETVEQDAMEGKV